MLTTKLSEATLAAFLNSFLLPDLFPMLEAQWGRLTLGDGCAEVQKEYSANCTAIINVIEAYAKEMQMDCSEAWEDGEWGVFLEIKNGVKNHLVQKV